MSGADVFSALGDPTRRRLFELLVDQGPVTATVLGRRIDISRQAAAKHLVILAEAGLATSRRQGRETLYRAETEPLTELTAWARRSTDQWQRRLDRLADATRQRRTQPQS